MASHLSDFFSEKSLLITGGSGFVGKCLLEKLLRSCPHVHTIYLLLRPKSGQTAQKRLHALLSSQVFEAVRQECGHQLAKVVAVSGDVTYDELGFSPTDRQTITESVSLIFNCAATIRFDEPLRPALQHKVGYAQTVKRLAQRCQRLEVCPRLHSL